VVERHINLYSDLYADQEHGLRVLVYAAGSAVKESDLASYAQEPLPPTLDWGAEPSYRGIGEFYDVLTEIRQALTARAAGGNPEGAREAAARLRQQIGDYLTHGL